MKKRIFTLLLALVMVVGFLPVTAHAGQLSNGLKYEVYHNRVEITGYTQRSTEVVIPAEIEGLPVTTIRNDAFKNCTRVVSVSIPATVTSIYPYAFQGCSSLTAFLIDQDHPNLTNDDRGVILGKTKTTLFMSPPGITGSYNVPDGVVSITFAAFLGCTSLTSVSIPDGVTLIDEAAFSGCTSLTSISIPDSVTKIGSGAFAGCSSLTGISIPEA